MPNPKDLTRAQILRAARTFRWTRKGMKWTVIVDDKELPARPLVLEAAGVAPNDPTNSHQAVEILKRLGFETRYAKEPPIVSGGQEESAQAEQGLASILEMAEAVIRDVPEQEWHRLPADLATNVDHYLYGARKKTE